MTEISLLLQDFIKTEKYKTSAGMLDAKSQSEVMAPAILVADLLSRYKHRFEDKQTISIAWIAPTGIELVDHGAWINTATDIAQTAQDIEFHFIGSRKPAPFNGPKPNIVDQLEPVKARFSSGDELVLNETYDLVIVGHNGDATEILKWKSDVVERNPDALVAALAWSEADQIVEMIKWEGLGYQAVDSWTPNYGFQSESEFGSIWANTVNILRKSTESKFSIVKCSTVWSYGHSVQSGMTNPIQQPLSSIDGVKFLKGGDDIRAVYLVDNLVLIPDYNMLLEYNFEQRSLKALCSIAQLDLDKMPSDSAQFVERYAYAAFIKLSYTKLEFESGKQKARFLESLQKSFETRKADAAMATQLAKHLIDNRETQFKIDVLKVAVGLGSVVAYLELSSLYRELGVNPSMVIELLKEAHKMGSAEASFNLAAIVESFPDFFSPENNESAIEYIKAAANLGFPEANYQYGSYLFFYSNSQLGLEHLEAAALFGHAEAIQAILEIHEKSMLAREITKKKFERIKRMYRRFRTVH